MGIETVEDVPHDLLDPLWRLYLLAFDELRSNAVQRHVMYHAEFLEVMRDRRVLKYIARDDDGVLQGLATVTNDLHAVPLISHEFFERRYPDMFVKRQIWYVGFVAVNRGGRRTRLFVKIIEAMYRTASENLGIVAVDVCRYNEETYGMPAAIQTILSRQYGKVDGRCVDEQSFWLYEFQSLVPSQRTRLSSSRHEGGAVTDAEQSTLSDRPEPPPSPDRRAADSRGRRASSGLARSAL
jgi:hypothetical protein